MDPPIRPERRKERREMHVDRRKSNIDVMEHVSAGVQAIRIRDRVDDRPRKRRK